MTQLVNLPEAPIECANLIAGELQNPQNVERIDVISPYTGSAIGTVPQSSHPSRPTPWRYLVRSTQLSMAFGSVGGTVLTQTPSTWVTRPCWKSAVWY